MEAIESINCDRDHSLKQALIDSAMQIFNEFCEEKSEDIVNKYKDDPRYVKACELLKERDQISSRLTEIGHELDSTLPSGYYWLDIRNSRCILDHLSGITDLREKLNSKIRNHVEIETSIPCFDPRHILSELNEIVREATSKINV